MSGTSGDGINLAAIEVEPGPRPNVRILATGEEKYPDAIRDAVLRAGADEPFLLSDVARLHGRLGDAYAAAAVTFIATLPKRPDVIALHGQTVAHLPAEHTTFQIGDEEKTLGPGEFFFIPGGVRHRVVALGEPVKVLDVFHPIREEYR